MTYTKDFFYSETWRDYVRLQEERPEMFRQDDRLRIVFNEDIILDYMNSHSRKIGVLYKSDYSMMVVDLVCDPKGNCFAYERLVPASIGQAVVIIPVYNDRLVLLEQFRHALRKTQYSFPRGFGENGLTAIENAKKEIEEELGAAASLTEELGSVIPDSGMAGASAAVIKCRIGSFSEKKDYEGICKVITVSKNEMESLIREGRITDGFTLAAWTLYSINQ